MNGYVYVVTNTVNGKQYVGQTTSSMRQRWREHVACARKGSVECRVFYGALRKHGVGSFVHEIVATAESQDQLDELERSTIVRVGSLVPAGYNLRSGGYGGTLHPETRAKLSASKKGQKRTPEQCARFSAALKGRKKSPETRAKLVEAWKRRRLTPVSVETRAKISAASKGRPVSDAVLAVLAEARKKIPPLSVERRAAIGAFHRGKVMSPDTRARMSAAHTGRTHSAETRAAMSEATRLRWQERKAHAV